MGALNDSTRRKSVQRSDGHRDHREHREENSFISKYFSVPSVLSVNMLYAFCTGPFVSFVSFVSKLYDFRIASSVSSVSSVAHVVLIAAALLAPVTAGAQNFPSKPIRLIIPFGPGGTNDILGRLVAIRLGEAMGQQVIADNRGGAGGSIGMELAAKSPPDGYTIAIGHVGTLAVNKTLYS